MNQSHALNREAADYNSSAFARIKNTTPVTLKSVTLYHQYSGDSEQSKTWKNVAPGATTDSMTVGFNTGFIRTGQDHWRAEYTLPDGSTWSTSSQVTETLHPHDDGTTKTLEIQGPYLKTWRNDTLRLELTTGDHYNNWAVVRLKNDFPVSAGVKMKHKYSSDTEYEHTFPVLSPGAVCDADDGFIVYYNTGFIRTGSDHWNVEVKLDLPPYDNADAEAFEKFTNSDSDKGCMLRDEDSGKALTFTVDGKHFTMGEASGSCTDNWKTWNGYNTLAFLQIENEFDTAISTAVLTHQYSGDTKWNQTRGLITAKGGKSSPLVAEYNTGFIRTGSDHWTIRVYLSDGTWYENKHPGKGCMLRTDDATNVSTFKVSKKTFTLGLASGGCTDSMLERGEFAPSMGRNPDLSYDKNAYIGSHNAYANFANGFWYAQQSESLRTQLGQGATTLLLDIWYDDGDIYLKHEDKGWLQPFVANQKLSTALETIREFLTLQTREPVTIVFEDRVEASHQSLIRKAFEDSDTWSMVFNPDTYDVGTKGWPTLNELFAMKTPIVVFTSNTSSPDFAYQWKYMSENVYGDASLDESTWLDPRSASRPLGELDLCALNHFPTWSVSGFILTKWIQYLKRTNRSSVVKKMIDACQTKWSRYPNYINADFWEIPSSDGMVDAIVYLNGKLTKAPLTALRTEHHYPIVSEYDHSRLLRGNWTQETQWVEQQFKRLCPSPESLSAVTISKDLVNLTNLVLVLGTLASAGQDGDKRSGDGNKSVEDGDGRVGSWVRHMLGRVTRYLSSVEKVVLAGLNGDTGTEHVLCAIPFLLLEAWSGIEFDVCNQVRGNIHPGGGHDGLLLSGLTGDTDTVDRLLERFSGTRRALSETTYRRSQAYDLTHEILYLNFLGYDVSGIDGLLPLLEKLLADIMSQNPDLGAELLASYWIAGGEVTQPALVATQQLKAHGDIERSDKGCEPAQFKEEVHERLTMLLGIGLTLGTQGEILDTVGD